MIIMGKVRKLFHTARIILLGKKCCLCNTRFYEYLPTGTDAKVWEDLHGIGAGKRKAICPHCGCSDRERLVYLYIKDTYLPKHSEKRIKCLHIAPENQLSFFLRSQHNIDYTAGDKRCDGYDYPEYVQPIDIMDLSSKSDNAYDLIICNHVLEHVQNDIVAMQGLNRILKQDGIAILQVPYALKLKKTIEDSSINNPETRFKLFGQSDHVRLYGTDYSSRLKRAGFRVEIIDIASRYSHKYGLNPDEKIHICHKQ